MKKYTIKEFFESKEKLAIHTLTEAQAIKLCNAFDEGGYSWKCGSSYKQFHDWFFYKIGTAYSNRGEYSPEEYYKSKGYTILTMNDIIFEDDKENKEYKVKIEVKKVDDRYNLYFNNTKLCYWSQTESLDVSICTLIYYIIGEAFTQPSGLQDYLLENHLVEPTEMTLKEIEEKLGVKNLKIVEEE